MLFEDPEQAAQEFAEILMAAETEERVEHLETFLDALDNRSRADLQDALQSFVS